MHRYRGRRPSDRIRLMNSFSKFTNTAENPVDLDEEMSDAENAEKNVEDLIAEDSDLNSEEGIQSGPPKERAVDSRKYCSIHKDVNVTGVETLLQDLSMDERSLAEKSKTGSKLSGESSSRVTRSHKKHVINLDTPETTRKVEKREIGYCSKKESRKRKKPKHDECEDIDAKKPFTTTHSGSSQRFKVNVIRTRTSPRTLRVTISALSLVQKRAVEEMGLSSLLEMDLDIVPSKLGYFVVDRLDTESMSIRIRNGVIPITVESIQEILGLPNEGVDLLAQSDVDPKDSVTSLWKDQFDTQPIRPKDVKNKILDTHDGGLKFKLNFLVLFVNLMGECKSMGTCALGFLSKITDEEMINKINWCQFIYDKVKLSKRLWKRESMLCFYSGPLTYLTLLYVHSTISNRVEIEQKKDALRTWNTKKLKQREATELADGGFGLLPLKDGAAQPMDMDNEAKSTPKGKGKQGLRAGQTREVFMNLIREKLSSVQATKKTLEDDFTKAFIKFKEDDQLVELKSIFDGLFGKEETVEKFTPIQDAGNGVSRCTEIVPSQPMNDPFDSCWDSPTFVGEVAETMRSVENSRAKKSLKNMQPPDFDLGTTPRKSESDHKIMSWDVNQKEKGQSNVVDDAPDFDLGFSPDKHTTSVPIADTVYNATNSDKDKGKKTEEEKTYLSDAMGFKEHGIGGNHQQKADRIQQRNSKRTVKLGDQLKSPYYNRIVDFNVSREEKKVHEWCLSMFGGEFDDVFRSPNCTRVKRTGMESLAAKNMNICPTVIDGWGTLLNYEERYRNKNSLRRYYFKMEIMADPLLRKRCVDLNTQYDTFIQTLSRTENNNRVVINMKDFDLIFFPMCDGYFYYLVVINIKSPSITILDNRKWKIQSYEVMLRRYEYVPAVLQKMIAYHLVSVGNPSGKALASVKLERVELEWQTTYHTYDSGVFVMRHMETFMGDIKWRSGLAEESQRQETQLEELKMKYAAKITLHSHNALKHEMQKEIATFYSMNEEARAQIRSKAVKGNLERVE